MGRMVFLVSKSLTKVHERTLGSKFWTFFSFLHLAFKLQSPLRESTKSKLSADDERFPASLANEEPVKSAHFRLILQKGSIKNGKILLHNGNRPFRLLRVKSICTI